jgi:hypothetical protein
MDNAALGPELAMLSTPVRTPMLNGVKVTWIERLVPGASVVCGHGLVTAKSPVTLRTMEFAAAVPRFESWRVRFDVPQRTTLPNAWVQRAGSRELRRDGAARRREAQVSALDSLDGGVETDR